ncbi:hypothetical protein [Streptomyces sp. NPDC050504]|uniref:hypothetical protein n=1 Tax=Streptomyces sp. NPDC050504 TaxID=3365618 RepID=UPI0037AF6AC0
MTMVQHYSSFGEAAGAAMAHNARMAADAAVARAAEEQPAETPPAVVDQPLRGRIAEALDRADTFGQLRLDDRYRFADAVLAVLPAPADRAAVLEEAADVVDNDDTCDCGGCDTCIPRAFAADLRRMAAEARGTGEQPDKDENR